ncbi:MAG: ribonuclease E inhibitor RraB [Bacteroidia bacterium]
MKKIIFLLFLLGSSLSFAQTKAEQTDLDVIKLLFKRMKEYKIDTKDTLLWTYTYADTSMSKLKNLSVSLEKEGLSVVEIKNSKYDAKKHELTVSEEKKYTVETLYERSKQLNEIAKTNKLDDYQARIGGERKKKQGDIGTYKPVGEKGKESGKK